MKKAIVTIIFIVTICLALTACDISLNGNGGQIVSQLTQLSAPGDLYVEDNIVKWKSVANADSYIISMNNREALTRELQYPIFDLISESGDISIKVLAKGNGIMYSDSDWSEILIYNYVKATVAGNSNGTKEPFSIPTNLRVENDKISWDAVEGAESYTIQINGDYEKVTSYNEYRISLIVDFSDTLTIKVRANETKQRAQSDWAVLSDYQYIAPNLAENDVKLLKNFAIGRGYNLIRDDYLDTVQASSKEVLDVRKLLSAGDFRTPNNQSQSYSLESIGSIDEFLSKTSLNLEYNTEVKSMLIGALKTSLEVGLDVDISTYNYRQSIAANYTYTYKDYLIDNLGGIDIIVGCLSANFLNDIGKKSNETRYMSDNELVKYIYDSYGTHAILGITTGATFHSNYTIVTNKYDVDTKVRAAFELSKDGGSPLSIFDLNTRISASLSEELGFSNENTKIGFDFYAYGGGAVGGYTRIEDLQTCLNNWSNGVNEDNVRSIKLTKNGAVSIANLIYHVNPQLGDLFESYVNTQGDIEYQSLIDKYQTRSTVSFELDSDENGQANVNTVNGSSVGGNYAYKIGDKIKIAAVPASGYKFSHWEVTKGRALDEELNTATLEFTIFEDTVLVARFCADNEVLNLTNEMKDYTFSAVIKTESKQQGRVSFTMTGIPVIYDGKEYIYGNAYYEGKISGGSFFGDVSRFSLLLDDTTALFGGLVSWCGPKGDSNKSGSAAWDSSYPHNTNELSYLEKNPTDDFAGNETVRITINGLCVKVGTPSKDVSSYPQIVKTSFSTRLYSESDIQGKITFDFYGINVAYNGCGYIYGCAFYNGRMGGKYFTNTAQISLRDSSVEILSGGVMLYRGAADNSNVCGVYSSSKLKVESNECYYMAENGDNDFPGNDNVTISITNMCIKVSDSLNREIRYLSLVEKDFTGVAIYAEDQYEDDVTLTAIGIKTVYNGRSALLGNAGFQGKIVKDHLWDCDSIVVKFDKAIAIQGGYLHYTGNHDDWNTQGTLASYSNGIDNTLTYYADNCGDDFPGKDATTTIIYISGICILLD